MSKVDFDEFAENYDELLRESTGFFTDDQQYFARYKVELARALIPSSPRTVLEFGCGVGRNIPYLQAAFPAAEVVGCDISRRSIEIARVENPGVRFYVEDGMFGESAMYDLAFVAGVFHHVPPMERLGVATLVHAKLVRGGTAIIFEHNPYNPVTRRIVSQCPYDKGVELLAVAELKRRLADAGFESIRSAYALFFPPALKRLTKIERLLSWLPLGGQYWVSARRP